MVIAKGKKAVVTMVYLLVGVTEVGRMVEVHRVVLAMGEEMMMITRRRETKMGNKTLATTRKRMKVLRKW